MATEKILIFGDSHSRYFEKNRKVVTHAPWVKDLNIDLKKVPASTIVGLGRKRSTLGLRDIIQEKIDNNPGSYAVFCFGQVDLELGYYYRRVIKGEDIAYPDFIFYLTNQYEDFIKSFDDIKVVVKGLNLTVLKDPDFAVKYVSRIISENIDDKDEANEAKSKLIDIYDGFSVRNKATLDFNSEMKNICARNNWKYFDINYELSSYKPGKGIDDIYVPSGDDHHLCDSIQTRILHLSYLKKLL